MNGDYCVVEKKTPMSRLLHPINTLKYYCTHDIIIIHALVNFNILFENNIIYDSPS